MAVIHAAGGTCRVLVATVAGRPPRPTVIEAREVSTASAASSSIRAILDEHGVGHVITVIPASNIVCRTCTLPQAADDELEEALRLQAEAGTMERTPEHRLGMSVLAGAPGETSRSGLILSWPDGAPAVYPPLDSNGDGPVVTFAPDMAGIAALLNGHRPADPLLWVDRSSGAIAMAVTHANGAVFRCMCEELKTSNGSAGWETRVSHALGETATSVGHSESFIVSQMQACEQVLKTLKTNGAMMMKLPPEIKTSAAANIAGIPSGTSGGDADWWNTYGIAAGVLLAATSEMMPLTMMQEAPEEAHPSRFVRVTDALSRPRTAMATCVCSLLLLAMVPVVMAGLRLAVAGARYPEIEQQVAIVVATLPDLNMYKALDKHAWPMTKLLSDVVSNTPPGLELTSIRLLQADASFHVEGVAIPEDQLLAIDLVNLMRKQLSGTGIFTDIGLTYSNTNNYGHYEFQLSAKISDPHRREDYDQGRDFATWTLLDRKSGRKPTSPLVNVDPDDDDEPEIIASNSDTDDVRPDADGQGDGNTDETSGDGRRSGRTHRAGLGSGGAQGTQVPSMAEDAVGAGPGAAPPPVTQADIDTMSVEELRKHMVDVSRARMKARREKDAELMERLSSEFDMIKDKLRGIQDGSAS